MTTYTYTHAHTHSYIHTRQRRIRVFRVPGSSRASRRYTHGKYRLGLKLTGNQVRRIGNYHNEEKRRRAAVDRDSVRAIGSQHASSRFHSRADRLHTLRLTVKGGKIVPSRMRLRLYACKKKRARDEQTRREQRRENTAALLSNVKINGRGMFRGETEKQDEKERGKERGGAKKKNK